MYRRGRGGAFWGERGELDRVLYTALYARNCTRTNPLCRTCPHRSAGTHVWSRVLAPQWVTRGTRAAGMCEDGGRKP